MEIESHLGNENFECQKRRLFETAEWTLQRLNQTINEMKSWTREREILTSDIYRLKIALGYSEKLLGDPLVMHQSQEIHRLERMNNDMRMKVESMSVALMNAERTVSWNVERKVRSEMATVKRQVAEEKLHLAREIARLRSELNEAKVDTTGYHEIRGKLDKYVEGDRQFDGIVAEAAGKLIDTVCQLSSELIKVGQAPKTKNKTSTAELAAPPLELLSNKIQANASEITNEINRLKLEKGLLLKDSGGKNHKIFTETELKVRTLTSIASSLRTKLIISLGRNKKLCEMLSDLESSKRAEEKESSVQTDPSGNRLSQSVDSGGEGAPGNEKLITIGDNCRGSYDVEGLDEKLMRVIEERGKLVDQLEMERTTTREALKEFEKSVKECEDRSAEITKIKIKLSITQDELKKLQSNRQKLRQLRLLKCKRQQSHNFFITKVNYLKVKLTKLREDLRRSEDELVLKDQKIDLLELKEKSWKPVQLEWSDNRESRVSSKNPEINSPGSQLKLENIRYNNEDVLEKINKRGIELKEFQESLESLALSGSRAIEPANTEDTCSPGMPERVKTSSEDLQVSYDVKHTSKEAQVMVSTELLNCFAVSSTSQGECVSVGDFYFTNSSEGIFTVDKCPWIIEQSQPRILELEREEGTKNPGLTGAGGGVGPGNAEVIGGGENDCGRDGEDGEGTIDKIEEKAARGHWTIKCKFPGDTTPEMIMRNLEATDRELSSVKSELSSVRGAIGSLRKELESRRFENRRLATENAALKDDIERMRRKIFRAEEENRRLTKLGKNGGQS